VSINEYRGTDDGPAKYRVNAKMQTHATSTQHQLKVCQQYEKIYARFYELGLTRELTSYPEFILGLTFCVLATFSTPVLTNSSLTCTSLVSLSLIG